MLNISWRNLNTRRKKNHWWKCYLPVEFPDKKVPDNQDLLCTRVQRLLCKDAQLTSGFCCCLCLVVSHQILSFQSLPVVK
uniref:Uncharacterized protein n=1 Tax=Rhizophora mucronata TaxID=61149 RepID=A0A2P2QYT6_RHIMU